jgi:TldD protein
MIRFHPGLYTDIRIETIHDLLIVYTNGRLENFLDRNREGAFIRVFDGECWYHAATTDLPSLQEEVDSLSALAKPNPEIGSHPFLKRMRVNRGDRRVFSRNNIAEVPTERKLELLQKFFPVFEGGSRVTLWQAYYKDRREDKHLISSLGADVVFDRQDAGITYTFSLAEGEKRFMESFQRAGNDFDRLLTVTEGEVRSQLSRCEDFLLNSRPCDPGVYPVVLSPMAAGIFAHESFGHKSEADFMLGDETMKREWALGKHVASPILSIVDDGNEPGSGYIAFDDEGVQPEKTYLIRDGILAGRLHSVGTASELGEEPTGNARAINFEYEPIVRMTCTYILPGTQTREELIAGIDDGYYIDRLRHGSGMSTFTLAPSLAYRIEKGKITYPVQISVVTGNVFETLGKIDGLSNEIELQSFVLGGCGKMEQSGLPVGFGGPYVKVLDLNVQ